MPASPERDCDVVVIGSGFGGTLAAHALVDAGLRVLLLERGGWVARGPENWAPEAVLDLNPAVRGGTAYRVRAGGNGRWLYPAHCVGGLSVFYGGVSLRLRERDFQPDPEIAGEAGAAWPFGYDDLEAYYAHAERILGVAGVAGEDPTEPRRSTPYVAEPGPLAGISRRIADAAESLGLHPFRLPLAIHYGADPARPRCIRCTTCDCFACAIGAKNDLATVVLPELLRRGLELRPHTAALRLLAEGGRVVAVECADRARGGRVLFAARAFVLAAGALATPHLLLASGLARHNPAGSAIGRYLMRHCNAIVFGFFPRAPEPEFHKQIGIHDFYFGHRSVARPAGPLGSLQQLATPPAGLVRASLPPVLRALVAPGVRHLTGLLVMAADQPRPENRVFLDPRELDPDGLPRLVIEHRHTARDRAALRALVRVAKRVLRRAGALFHYVHPIRTFSHAVGTVRAGPDPDRDPLDEWCRFRGLDNLYVLDASFFPTSGAVNPSLTIAANALRCANHLARTLAPGRSEGAAHEGAGQKGAARERAARGAAPEAA